MSNGPFNLWDEKIVYPGKNVAVKSVKFRLKHKPEDKEGVWEIAYRTDTKKANIVAVVGWLRKDEKKYFVLTKIYRIGCRSWVMEFPNDPMNNTEKTLEEAGMRILKNQTGYTSKKCHLLSNGSAFLDKALTDGAYQCVLIEINDKDPIPISNSEYKNEILLIECDKLLEFLDEANRTGGVEVLACLYSFALGYCCKDKFSI